jgi:hypothetical protein
MAHAIIGMIKDLYLSQPKKRTIVQKDDLKYDGSNLVIPSYWTDSLFDFLARVNKEKIEPADLEDLSSLKHFLADVIEHKAEGN